MEKCLLCKGRGTQVHIQQIGPGMVQQIQTVCVECKGQGECISPKDRCENCQGAKVVHEKKVIEVHVEKGEGPGLGVGAGYGLRAIRGKAGGWTIAAMDAVPQV